MFSPRMAQARRKGLADYGLLAQRYVESFDQKWVRESLPLRRTARYGRYTVPRRSRK
jgi:hypothetical protein